MKTRSSVVAAILGAIVIAMPVSARITRSRPSPTQTWSRLTPITIGSGIEYESNDESREFHLPALFEYNFTERFRVSLETEFARIRSDVDPEAPVAEALG